MEAFISDKLSRCLRNFSFNCFLLEFCSLLYDKMTGHFWQNFRKWNFDLQRFKTLKERHRKKFLDLHIFSNFIISFFWATQSFHFCFRFDFFVVFWIGFGNFQGFLLRQDAYSKRHTSVPYKYDLPNLYLKF